MTSPQVAILCGGRGRRLGDRTKSVPKALAPLNGRPILDYVLDFYRSKGFSRFVLCVGYKAQQVVERYSQSEDHEVIEFSDAGEQASMLQRIWALKDVVQDRLVVSYCDTFIDLDMENLLSAHQDAGAAATIVTAQIRSPFGLVDTDPDGWVSSFVEKPLLNYYIGCFVIEKSAFEAVTVEMLERPDGDGLVAFFGKLVGWPRLLIQGLKSHSARNLRDGAQNGTWADFIRTRRRSEDLEYPGSGHGWKWVHTLPCDPPPCWGWGGCRDYDEVQQPDRQRSHRRCLG